MDTDANSTDWREYDPDLLTICPPRKRRADRTIKSGADLFPKEQGGIFGMIRNSLPSSAPAKPLPKGIPDFPTVWHAMWFVRHKLLAWRLREAEDSVRMHIHGETLDPWDRSERKNDAFAEWKQAVLAMLRIPSRNDQDFSYKTGRDQLYYSLDYIRKHIPEWGSLIDEERARLDAEKAQRRAARVAKKREG